MARRGTPLSFSIRKEIWRHLEQGIPQKHIASILRVSKNTVAKYTPRSLTPQSGITGGESRIV
jgi:DNA-binding CsgD family transcriptional regulator